MKTLDLIAQCLANAVLLAMMTSVVWVPIVYHFGG